jgi:LysR family hydrogen peroxide-inducible transcriptional activator
MNLQDFRYIAAVSSLRHFGRAAEACNVSQPTLSSQIRKLEEELGVALFERTNKRVELTPIGEHILEHANRSGRGRSGRGDCKSGARSDARSPPDWA